MNFDIVYAKNLYAFLQEKKGILIDIRDKIFFEKNCLRGAINLPVEETDFEKVLSKNEFYVFYCEHGATSIKLARYLGKRGYHTATLMGGYEAIKK